MLIALLSPVAAVLLLTPNIGATRQTQGTPPVQGGAPKPGPIQPGLTGAQPDGTKPASAPAPIPLTPEQIQDRLAVQLTGLATRVQALRKLGNITAAPPNSGKVGLDANGKPTLEWLRTIVGEIAREVLRRGQAIEVPAAAQTAERLLAIRTIPKKGFIAAPESKLTAEPPRPEGPVLPADNPELASEVIYRVGAAPITRGELYAMLTALKPYSPESTAEQIAKTSISRALIPSAVVAANFPSQLAAALQKAKDIREQIVSGKLTFEDAVKNYSEDPRAKLTAGLVDGAMASFLNESEHVAISKLKPGEISQPFLFGSSVEIVRLEKIEAAVNPSQTKLFYRVIQIGLDLGIPAPEKTSKIRSLVLSSRIDVLDPEFELFIPPSMAKTVMKKDVSPTASRPK
jgi:hypothetical protein